MGSLPLWSFPGFYPQFPGQWWRRAYHQLWDEVERITSSNPADILQQVTNNPQWGPSTCVADSEFKRMKQKNYQHDPIYKHMSKKIWKLVFATTTPASSTGRNSCVRTGQSNPRVILPCLQDEYEPDSLRTMLAAFNWHLSGCGWSYSIMTDREFKETCAQWKGNSTKGKQEEEKKGGKSIL